MLFELRRYRLLPGTGPAMLQRIKNKVLPLFAKLGIAPPIGVWDATAGDHLPQFVWLLRWDSFAAREKSWAAFYGPWQTVRGEGEAPGQDEYVMSTGLSLLTAWPECPIALPAPAQGCHELWVRRVTVSQAPAAKSLFLDHEAKLLAAHGGRILGAFDYAAEPDLPQHALFLAWPDANAREAAMRAYDDDPELGEKLRTTRNISGRPVIRDTDRLLLRPAAY
ncbi:MAG: NIPSNAP family protein [Rhodospirillaceae bacterium]|nr:NIPSNAP family protein [Rhodospirillaceae bacterium]